MEAGNVIATILRHDKKTASYKIALVRSINDIVLGYPNAAADSSDIAVPLRLLATFWIAYYWPFAVKENAIPQARQARGKSDISFRPSLSELTTIWTNLVGMNRPADGFYLVTELLTEHRRKSYPPQLIQHYETAINAVVDAIQQPVRYAGPGEYSVFSRPIRWRDVSTNQRRVSCIPGTQGTDLCILIDALLWQSFSALSLWIEALCIHEWCMFTEELTGIDRGLIYTLLTDRPENRRPLTWERNEVEILMMEGETFNCPWTERSLKVGDYDLDHLVPVSVYPINELWNLVPADRDFNQHKKRDRVPSYERLARAQPHLANTYNHYGHSRGLGPVLRHDASIRFSGRSSDEGVVLADSLAGQVADYIRAVANARNLASF